MVGLFRVEVTNLAISSVSSMLWLDYHLKAQYYVFRILTSSETATCILGRTHS